MTARDRAFERWNDPDAVPPLPAVLREAGDLPQLNEGTLAAIASELCDVWGIDDGPLLVRLGALRERGLSQPKKKPEPALSDTATDLLDSLTGCALSVGQIVSDTGRSQGGVVRALQRLRLQGLVARQVVGKAYVYRITEKGRKALRGSR